MLNHWDISAFAPSCVHPCGPLIFSIFTQSHVARQQPLFHLHDDLIHTIVEQALFQLS